MKKVVSVLMALALSAIMAVPVFAASTINENEQRVLDRLASVNVAGYTFTTEQINLARNFFLQDNVDLPAYMADDLIAQISAAENYAVATGATDPAQLSQEQRNVLFDYAYGAGQTVGVDLRYIPGTGIELSWNPDNVIDAAGLHRSDSGRSTGSSGSAIKQTGIDFGASWILVVLAVAATAGSAVFVKKSRAEA